MYEKLPLEKRIERTHARLMGSKMFCFLSGILMLGKVEITDKVATAATDGYNVYYNRDFCMNLPEKEFAFVVAHEAYHKAFRQLTVWKRLFEEDAQLANMACVFAESLVTMGDGSYKRADEISVGEQVMTPLGAVPVLAVAHSDKDKHCALDMHTGHKLYCTSDHRVLTKRGYKRADEIQAGEEVLVDVRNGPPITRTSRDYADQTNRRSDGEDRPCSLQEATDVGAIGHTDDCETTELQGFGTVEGSRLGLFCGFGGRRGDSILPTCPKEISSSSYMYFKHILNVNALVREFGDVRNCEQERLRKPLLAHRTEWVRAFASAGKNSPLCASPTETIRHFDRAYQRAAKAGIPFPADTTHHVAFAGAKGFEYARVTNVRQFSTRRRVVDITTPGQCFVAAGVVVHNCDYVINLLICDADPSSRYVAKPQQILYNEKYRNKDTRQVFNELKKQQNGKGQGKGSLDEHMWEEANGVPEEQQKKIADQIERALREGKMLADKLKSGGNRALDEILEPEVDWRQHLREFVMEVMGGKDTSTWSRPNRRYLSQGMIMPGTYSETVGELVVAADMSGSVGGQLLAMFLGEMGSLAEMLQPAKLHLLYWDTEVCRHEIYLPGQYESLVSSTKPKGGGGTSPSCITEYMKAHRIVPACTVVLTDGYVGGDWGGQWPSPVLWAVCGDRHASPTTGKMVPLREE